MASITVEVCVDSIASALAAQAGGAQRIELCASLLEGGLTPSAGTIEVARQRIDVDINIMIRPRGGDFLYSDDEIAMMRRDIEVAKALGANGVVFGLLTENGAVDIARTAMLCELARPLSVNFHRAFDMVVDVGGALDALIALGVDRVLTSGLEADVFQGAATIAALIRQADEHIIVMPGGGVNADTIAEIVRTTGAREIHMSGRAPMPSQMRYHNPRVHLGGTRDAHNDAQEYSLQVTSATHIRASLNAIRDL